MGLLFLFKLAQGMCQPPGQALKEDLPPTAPPSSAPTETRHPHGTPVANRPGGRRAEAHRRNGRGLIKHFFLSSEDEVLHAGNPGYGDRVLAVPPIFGPRTHIYPHGRISVRTTRRNMRVPVDRYVPPLLFLSFIFGWRPPEHLPRI